MSRQRRDYWEAKEQIALTVIRVHCIEAVRNLNGVHCSETRRTPDYKE